MKYRSLFAFLLMFLLILSVSFKSTVALAASKTDMLVNEAIKAGQLLENASQIDKKATGKNVPQKEYESATKKYNVAKKAVNKLATKQRKTYAAKLDKVNTQIDRGKKYIAAVKAGKVLETRRSTFTALIKSGNLDQKTIDGYVSLLKELRNNNQKINYVYGAKTRAALTKIYISPSKKLVDGYQYTFTVKQAIDDSYLLLKQTPSIDKLAVYYKKIVLNIDLVENSVFKKTLQQEIINLNTTIPTEYKTEKLGNLISLESNFNTLDQLISPGKSNEKVPGLYAEIQTTINNFSASEKSLLQKRLQTIMSQLPLDVKKIKEMITKAAFLNGVPPEIVKAIAITENGKLQQFYANGEVFQSTDKGYGIMQITPQSENDQQFDWNKVKYDTKYNIETGVEVLMQKWNYATAANPLIPTINAHEKNILENWYFAIMAYNGSSYKNNPLVSANPYQEKVYNNLKNRALVSPYVLQKEELKISKDDLTGLLSFQEKMAYKTSKTYSSQLFIKGNSARISTPANFRKSPSTSGTKIKVLPAGITITIISGPIEDDSAANLFTWYKISVNDSKEIGYIASSNLVK